MKTIPFIGALLLVLAVAFSGWIPWTNINVQPASAAGTMALTIQNPLPASVTITLKGPREYTFNVFKGQTINKTIDAGTYKFTYKGCLNKLVKGNLKAKGATAALKIKPCKMATWRIMNLDNQSFLRLKLDGWVDYNVSVGPGSEQLYQFVADTYTITANFCGDQVTRTQKISGKKTWWWVCQ